MGANRRELGLLAGVVVLATAIAVGAYAGHLLRSLELTSVDTRFSIRGAVPQPRDLVVVAIDDKTFGDFTQFSATHPGFRAQWPFPRCDTARVLDRIGPGHPKVIAVDLQFTERTTDLCDNALIEAVGNARPVVLGTTEVNDNGGTNVFGGLPLENLGAAAGSTVMPADYGGVIRRVPYAWAGLTSFGIVAAAIAERKPVPTPRHGNGWIDYVGGPGAVKTYSYSDVYFGKVPQSAFRDKTVVVGVTSPSLQDVHLTSVSGDPANEMPGPELQANVIETALQGFPLRTTPVWLNALLIVVFAALPAFAIVRLRPLVVLPLAIAVGLVFALLAQLAFDHGRIVLFVYPLIALALSTFGSMIVSYEAAITETGSRGA